MVLVASFKIPLAAEEKRGRVLLIPLGRAETFHVAKGVLVSCSGLGDRQHAVPFISEPAWALILRQWTGCIRHC